MLCSYTPLSISLNSVIGNVKTFYRFDKYFPFEKQHEDFFYLNTFVKQLNLSPKVFEIMQKNLKLKNGCLYFHTKACKKDVNLFFKRDFHSRWRSSNESKSVKSSKLESTDGNTSKQFMDIISKYSLKPQTQTHLFEAHRLGYEKSISLLLNEKNKYRNMKYLMLAFYCTVAIFVFIYALDFIKSFTSSISNRSFSKHFSKSWTESGATLVTKVDVKFDDVQGCDEVKKELQDVVYFLKNPSAFIQIGAKLPKGVLLSGAPGIGKTLLARAVAGEAGVPFIYISGSQFDEMFVGVGASRVRSLFNEAKEHSPCVVFIDELDAVGSERTSSPSHPYANQTINQLLAEMDGFVENEGIVVIGATNRIESLDKAVLRPGRFDMKVQVHRPDYRGRIALFDLYLSKIVADENIDISLLARSSTGYTGADIKNMVNQAAIICVLNDDSAVTMSHLWESQTKTSLGAARSRPTQESDNRLTAFHEAGHSIVMYYSPNSPNKVKLVTILPRGESGGHNSFVPKVESSYQSKAQLMSIIDSMMGGRAAEELLNGADNISTGISSDMQQATNIARTMVRLYSMSDEVGLQVFDSNNCSCGGSSKSPKVAEAIDNEVNRILKESYERAKLILQTHHKQWHSLAHNLLKYETLEGDDVELVINGKTPKIATITEEMTEKLQKSSNSNGADRLFGFLSNKDSKK